jgi:hypothetical protein
MSDRSDRDEGAPAEPSVRQWLHSATGDRDAEARTLAEEADVSEEHAEHAVRTAAGDEDAPAAQGNIARPAATEAEVDKTEE